MAKKMLIDATHAEETRVVVVDGTKVEEFDFETLNKRQISGNIYLAKVTRVEPSLQAAFVDYGGNRHGFLAFAEIHPDYYQIPAADRAALIAEERAHAEEQEAEETNHRPARRSAASIEDDQQDETSSDDEGADASDKDDSIESVAEEDVAEEIRAPKKPRARRYKIQEVVKVRQIMLVQVVKEERGNKGAALTTYLSLAGRYCVLMPNTARGGGISRKITNIADRKKLKDIAGELDVPRGAGLIIRTAGSMRTRTEIHRDYEYLLRLWEQIREVTFKSIAPAPIYEEGDLIKRTIRDLYSAEIDEVLVEGERGYHAARDFMTMIMPNHTKNVHHYTDQMPLFARFQVESYLGGMFNPTVQLKSGGYIVIGVTEALVAIDVNSGRATKEGSIEETATKTNLEAADEVARQLRLRDLAGLIVIDFIDMDERRNNAAVEKRMKDKLKSDRARIQVGRISGFGLMEMSRQRLRPGMLESTTQPCAHCHGTGLIRSDDSLAITILRAIEDEGTRNRSAEVLLRAPVAVANFLMNQKREHVANIETRYGLSVRVEADPALISPDYTIEKLKTATRVVPEVVAPVLSVNADLMARIDSDHDGDEDDDGTDAVPDHVLDSTEDQADGSDADNDDAETGDSDEGGRKRRRRRRRRKTGDRAEDQSDIVEDDGSNDDTSDQAVQTETPVETTEAASDHDGEAENGRGQGSRRPRGRSRSRTRRQDASQGEDGTADAGLPDVVDLRDDVDAGRADEMPGVNAPHPRTEPTPEPAAQMSEPSEPATAQAEPVLVDEAAARNETPADTGAVPETQPESVTATQTAPEPQPEAVAPVQETPLADAMPEKAPELAQGGHDEAAPLPKRRGWWSA